MPGFRGTAKERLQRHIVKNENDCWMWQGARSGSGYGQMNMGRGVGPKLVHRIAYQEYVGPIPVDEDGKTMFIDHKCYDSDGYSNKLCCNPEHLEPVTDLINKRRGYKAKREAGTWVHYKNRKPEVE